MSGNCFWRIWLCWRLWCPGLRLSRPSYRQQQSHWSRESLPASTTVLWAGFRAGSPPRKPTGCRLVQQLTRRARQLAGKKKAPPLWRRPDTFLGDTMRGCSGQARGGGRQCFSSTRASMVAGAGEVRQFAPRDDRTTYQHALAEDLAGIPSRVGERSEARHALRPSATSARATASPAARLREAVAVLAMRRLLAICAHLVPALDKLKTSLLGGPSLHARFREPQRRNLKNLY